MKKVGIVTYQYNNYGTKLQNFAMIKALENLGFVASSISVRPRKDTFVILAKLLLKTSPLFVLKKYTSFRRFDKKYLNKFYTSYGGLSKSDAVFDYFISGSDQVWSPKHLRSRTLDRVLFFLSFVSDKNKRIAYAPSFGVETIAVEDESIYSSDLSNFSYLSAREESGSNIIESVVGDPVAIVPDPTFLLNNDDWNDLTADSDKKYIAKKYLAVYYLSDQPKEVHLRIKQYALDNNLQIITVSGDLHTKGSIVPDPAEFVSVIKNAQVVFTDSFHACVFSIINKTPFIVRQRSDVSQFTRVENLLSKYDMRSAIDNGGDISNTVNSLDFSSSEKEIITQKDIGITYLKGALTR